MRALIAAFFVTVGVDAIKSFKPYNFAPSHPLFHEQFQGPTHTWIATEDNKIVEETKALDGGAPIKETAYSRDWSIAPPTVFPGFDGDMGLLLKQSSAYYAISTAFPRPVVFSRTDSFILQYEVKLQEGLECGGAHIRLLRATPDVPGRAFRPERLTDRSPLSLTFGPQRCGSTDKVLFNFFHVNKRTGQASEKQLIDPPMMRSTKLSTLYTLIVRPDGGFEIRINREKIRHGSLYTDFDPPLNTPAEVDDPSDVRSVDWVDEEKIPDPAAVRPSDWDNGEPKFIVDRDARIPEGWLPDEPEMIPDPKASKPETWKSDRDGEWIAPLIVNPRCAVGCGQWIPPSVPNPKYRGEWKPPLVDNPAYKGPWRARRIPNPAHYTEDAPSALIPAAGIGFELFTTNGGILFDNILLTNNEQQANDFAIATWEKKYDLERIALEKELQKQGLSNELFDDFDDASDAEAEHDEAQPPWPFFRYWRNYLVFLLAHPLLAIKGFPLLTINTILLGICLLATFVYVIEDSVRRLAAGGKRLTAEKLKNEEDTPLVLGADAVQKSHRMPPGGDLVLSTVIRRS